MTRQYISRGIGALAMLLWATLGATNAQAQDAHYWDNQYGTKAELLGGLVVGSPTDLSSTFYNPGWIALQKGPSVLLTTKAAEAYSIRIKNDLGQGIDPTSTVVAPSPGYFAGRFSLGEDWGWNWAYTYLQKVKFEYNASSLRIEQNLSPAPGGNTWFSGEVFRDSRVDESWYGISLSRKLTENIALGFSPYVAQRSHRSRGQVAAQALDAGSTYADAFLVDEFDYWHIRMLLKFGLAIEWERWTAGLAVTTPSLGILGDGNVHQSAALSGDYEPDNPGIEPPYLQANVQEGLDPVWKSPLSIAAGAAVKIGQSKIHFSAEWFNSVARYQVLDPVPYEIQSAPDQFDAYELEYAARSVVNYGLGVERIFSEDFSLFTSYRADFSSTPDDFNNNLSITIWDLNHLTGGASFQFMNMEFTAGVQYSWGRSDSSRFASFNVSEEAAVNEQFADQEITYRRVKVLLGFNLPFTVPGG